MITKEPTKAMIEEWQAIWLKYKDKLQPNRKSGTELLEYLQNNYILTELFDKNVLDTIVNNVTMNIPFAEKLPKDTVPIPRAFILENQGKGQQFYKSENQDPVDVWGKATTRIFIGIDIVSGYYMVEGSTMLWDELCAFIGLDEMDLQNYVCVAQYINSLKRNAK